MKPLRYILLLCIPVMMLAGCRYLGKEEEKTDVESGKVIDNTSTLEDQNITYSVYLPKAYTGDTAYPAILCFDPQGSGNLPVAMYKDLAEQYGYIIVGSDNSKNGLDGNSAMGVITSMVKEVKKRFSVDTTRLYTMGFSGGARIAVMAAFNPGGIRSVTGSGAGFPNTGSAFPYHFDYLGMAGTSDFNMHEMIMLDKYLDQAQNHHGLILFEGKHGWPPVDVMEKSFIWNDFCAMRNKRTGKDTRKISSFRTEQDSLINRLKEEGDVLTLRRELRNAISFLDQLEDVEGYRKELSDLENSAAYGKAMDAFRKMQERELAEQQKIQQNFFRKDTAWWNQQLSAWDQTISQGKDNDQVLMTRRLQGYLSLVCYMNYTKAREANETNAAAQAMWLYRKVDPEHAAQTENGK